MLVQKCPSCAYRIIQPGATPLCPNCGEPLPNAMSQESSNRLSRPLAPHQTSDFDWSELPRSSSFDTTPIGDTPIIIDNIAAAKRDPRQRPPKTPLFGFSSIEGTVVSVQNQQEHYHSSDFLFGLLKAIRDGLWPMQDVQQQQREDRVIVTMVRLRLADDTQREARLEGYLIGSSISLGDRLELRGRYRKGILMVTRAHNTTSHAQILTRQQSSSPLLLIISFPMLILMIYLLLQELHR